MRSTLIIVSLSSYSVLTYKNTILFSTKGYAVQKRQDEVNRANITNFPYPDQWDFNDKAETKSMAKIAYICKDATNKVDKCQVCHSLVSWKKQFNEGRKRQQELQKREEKRSKTWAENHRKSNPMSQLKIVKEMNHMGRRLQKRKQRSIY